MFTFQIPPSHCYRTGSTANSPLACSTVSPVQGQGLWFGGSMQFVLASARFAPDWGWISNVANAAAKVNGSSEETFLWDGSRAASSDWSRYFRLVKNKSKGQFRRVTLDGGYFVMHGVVPVTIFTTMYHREWEGSAGRDGEVIWARFCHDFGVIDQVLSSVRVCHSSKIQL